MTSLDTATLYTATLGTTTLDMTILETTTFDTTTLDTLPDDEAEANDEIVLFSESANLLVVDLKTGIFL